MPRLSTLSNPTGLVDLDKQRLSILVDESGKRLAFSLARLDLSGLALPADLTVVVVARRGNAEERVELGSVSGWDKSFRYLTELGEDGSWSFRVLLLVPGSAKLAAAAENIRPEGQGDSSSFIALEPADLGQRPWEITILEQEGRAVLYFNKEIYHSSAEAEADKFFIGLVLPEAVRQLAGWVARNPSVLEDPPWEAFRSWLELHGITEDLDMDNDDAKHDWCATVVNAFCERFQFVALLREARAKGVEE